MPAAFFLALSVVFLRISRMTFLLMVSARSWGVSHGSTPVFSEKGNSCANSSLLNGVVNLSFFLALGVMFGLGGTGGFLGPIDQLREPRLHRARFKIIVARGRSPSSTHTTGWGPKRLAYFFGPMA